MTTWQFESLVSPDQTLRIPQEVAQQLPPEATVRVLLMIDDSEENEDAEWQRFAAEQFLKGYAPGDAIYDEL
jgi:hypothetical protein